MSSKDKDPVRILKDLLSEAQSRLYEYDDTVGEYSRYLEGKIVALCEALEELDPEHADAYGQIKLSV